MHIIPLVWGEWLSSLPNTGGLMNNCNEDFVFELLVSIVNGEGAGALMQKPQNLYL